MVKKGYILLGFLLGTFVTLGWAKVPSANHRLMWRAVAGSYGGGKPKKLHGGRVSYQWQKQDYSWRYADMYFDVSAAHWTTNWSEHTSIDVLGIAPVFRLPILTNNSFQPYLEGSVGAAFMSSDRIATRKLGANLAFQDILGAGATFGSDRQYDLSLRYLHYSNAHLAPPNEGIDVKFLVTLGYRF